LCPTSKFLVGKASTDTNIAKQSMPSNSFRVPAFE
jgi:hypothetical protein